MTISTSIVGTAGDDTINLRNDAVGRTVVGLGGGDDIRGTQFADLVLAGWGNDRVDGGAGDDVIRGNDSVPSVAPLAPAGDGTPAAPTGPATIAFESEDAGYQSAVGMYKISADGTITDVQLLYERVERSVLTAGQQIDLGLASGDTVGFFLLPNAWRIDESNGGADLLDPSLQYELRHPNSLESGTVGAGKALELWSLDPITGAPRIVEGQYGTSVFHTATDANPDGAVHARVTNNADGTIEVSFEDLVDGGNEGADAFGDAVFTIDMNGHDVRVLGSPDESYTENSDGSVTLGGTNYAVGETDATIEVDGVQRDVTDVETVTVDGVKYVVENGEVTVTTASGTQTLAIVADDTGDTLGKVVIDGDEHFVEAGRIVTVGADVYHLRADGTFNIGGTTVTDDDRLHGGDGDDTIYGGVGNDRIEGGDGDDVIRGEVGDDLLHGGAGNDRIRGSEGADRIWGNDGDDAMLNGGEGDDLVYGGRGDDVIRGGQGDDRLRGDAGDDRILGDTGADDIRGGDGDDRINGGTGDDYLHGNQGNDKVSGGDGDDVIEGGDETPVDATAVSYGEAALRQVNDELSGGEGDDRVSGGAGHDRLYGGKGHDRVAGGLDNDFVKGASGDDWLFGDDKKLSMDWDQTTSARRIADIARSVDTLTGGNDSLVGDNGDDRLFGQGGDDTLKGNSGNDVAYGGHGDDFIAGGTGNDFLDGGEGDDDLWAGKDDDEMHGGAGNDVLCGQSGNDVGYGGTGQDRLIGHSGDDELHGGADGDYLAGGSGDDMLYGDEGDDWLSGSSGVDVLHGGEGNDTLHGGSEGDTLDGDAGNDRLYGTSGNDTLNGGEGDDRLDGGTDDDVLSGGDGADILIGSDGADVLDGGAGDDALYSGKGNDTLTGGAGNDRFVFTRTDRQIDEIDTITDFAAGDVVSLRGLGLSDSSKVSIVEDAFVDGDAITLRTSEWKLQVGFEGGAAAAADALVDLQDGTVPDWLVL